jgi:endonuclease/exonuclease/phosphatase family metal-dependent hydrolase
MLGMPRLPDASDRAVDRLLTASTVLIASTAVIRASGRQVKFASPALAFVPSMVVVGAALAVVAERRGRRRTARILAGSAAVLAWFAVPRLFARRQPAVVDVESVKVMSANVFKGAGSPEGLVELVRTHRPDVLALQEQSPRYMEELRRAGLLDLLPNGVVGGGWRLNDAGLLSAHEVEAIEDGLPSVFVGGRVTLPSGRMLPFLSAHPMPPARPWTERHWTACLAELPAPAGDYVGGLVAGDFNATHDHPQFRRVLASGWRDAGRERGKGWRSTWRGTLRLLHLSIDHILVPPGAAVDDYRVDTLAGSDHRVITATVRLPAEG